MGKWREWLLDAAHWLFGLLVCAICLVTLFLDKRLKNNPFPNAVKVPNAVCFAAAFLLLAGVWFLRGWLLRKGRALPEKGFFLLLAGTGAAALLLQLPVMFWAPPAMSSDFGYVTDMAIRLARGESFAGHAYFVKSSNNVNITILLSWIYRLCGSWRAVICLGALLANVSALLAAFAVVRAGGGRTAAWLVCLAGELLAAFSYRACIPYTDVYGMPFAAGMMALYYSRIRREWKLPGLVLLGAAGAWVKITLIIPLLALLIVEFLKEGLPSREALRLRNLLTAAALIILLAAGAKGSSLLRTHYGCTTSENTLGWQYMFMAGQDNTSLGQATGKDYRSAWKKIRKEYGTREERMRACRDTALAWIRARGFAGNVKFYLKKLDVAYDDGQFHDVRPYKKEEVSRNMVFQLYDPSGKYYDGAAFLKQVVWDMILLLLLVSLLTSLPWGRGRPESRSGAVPEITILGIVLYMLLFEGRSKYLFMFLPVYFTLAGIGFGRIRGRLEKSRKITE